MKALSLIFGLAVAACDQMPASVGGYTYRPEVGYREGDKEVWNVGPDMTRERCVAEARSQFNAINFKSPGRAFSWACRQMQGERFLDRVR